MTQSNSVNFVIDFDSTFVSVESLDELSRIALSKSPRGNKLVAEIEAITRQGMEGKLDFRQSLSRRLTLFSANKKHLNALIATLKKRISPSIKRNRDFFRQNKGSIYIISGGFSQYIEPVVADYGIDKTHIIANSFEFSKSGKITGFDTKNPLSSSNGKAAAIKKLKLKSPVYVIGDGMTDLEIKKQGAADRFYAYTENVHRDEVVQRADCVIPSFDELLYRLKLPRSLSYPKNRIRVLLLENINKSAVERFTKEGYDVESLESAMSEEELLQKIESFSVLGIRSKTVITKKVLEKAKKLLAIGAFCIGTNQIDTDVASQKGIAVFNAPYSNSRSVVELALGHIIALSRQLTTKNDKLHAGIWDKSVNGCYEIRGKKLGIVGYGKIGSQLSVLAENLGMEVFFYNTSEKLALGNAKRCASLHELCKKADMISVHVDGKEENRNLFSAKEFTTMKKGALFINLSRGFVVNVPDLAYALKSGHLSGAAIDVFPTEPKSNKEKFVSELQNMPNTILTPHIGGNTIEAQQSIAEFVTSKIIDFVNAGNTTLSVNMPAIQLPALSKSHRLIHVHTNTPGVLAKINRILADKSINIVGQYLRTNQNIGYVITDVNRQYDSSVVNELRALPETLKLRVLY